MAELREPKTRKAEQTKAVILQEAFKLFLMKGYENATMVELMKATGLSRGAIFYYAEDKFSLFKEVADKFLLESQSFYTKINYESCTSFYAFIKEYIRLIKTVTDDLMSIPGNTSQAYIGLIFQTARYYPEFNEKINDLFEQEHLMWERALEDGINRGEIRADIDRKQIACQFWHAYLGYSLEVCFRQNVNADELYTLYMIIYDTIKI